jgi:hypothetical protein
MVASQTEVDAAVVFVRAELHEILQAGWDMGKAAREGHKLLAWRLSPFSHNQNDRSPPVEHPPGPADLRRMGGFNSRR